MSQMDQERLSRDVRVTAALPPKADIRRMGRHVRKVPLAEIVAPFRGTGIGIALVSSGGIVMKLFRRQFLHLAAGAIALPAVSRIARAQNYPDRPVKMIVPFAPGGPADIMARLLAQKLSERFGKQFYVVNQGGAGGNIGMGNAAHAEPDGYTLVLVSSSYMVNPSLYPNVPYDQAKDFLPITLPT